MNAGSDIHKLRKYLLLYELLYLRLPAVVLHEVARPFVTFILGELRIHSFVQLVRLTVDAVQIFGKIGNRPVDTPFFQILPLQRSLLTVGVLDRLDCLPIDFDLLFGQPLSPTRFRNDLLCVHDCASFSCVCPYYIVLSRYCQGFRIIFPKKIFTSQVQRCRTVLRTAAPYFP